MMLAAYWSWRKDEVLREIRDKGSVFVCGHAEACLISFPLLRSHRRSRCQARRRPDRSPTLSRTSGKTRSEARVIASG